MVAYMIDPSPTSVEASPDTRQTVLVADDAADNRELLAALLGQSWRVMAVANGQAALDIAAQYPQPDLILLDVGMPGLDGYEVCERLKSNPFTADIPVIFLTGRLSPEDEMRGFEVGGVEYITKPIVPRTMLARVRTHLTAKLNADLLKKQSEYFEQEVVRRTQMLMAAQQATIAALGIVMGMRTPWCAHPVARTQQIVRLLVQRLQWSQHYSHELSDELCEQIVTAAPLYDLGKAAIPDHLLLKPDLLNDDERVVMQAHAKMGAQALHQAERLQGVSIPLMQVACDMALCHQEWWNGTGYPQQLAGTDIPLPARIMALVDVYSALVSVRPHRPALSHEQALAVVLAGRGSQFDPHIVDVFRDAEAEVASLVRQYPDRPLAA